MSPRRKGAEPLVLDEAALEALLARSAAEGARQALAEAGLDGRDAALDIRDLRALLDAIRFIRRTAVQSAVHIITTGLILALLAGVAIRMKLFGDGG